VGVAGAQPGDSRGTGTSRHRAMTADEALATRLQFLKGVGPRRAADLERTGLVTVEDLLYRFPLRYEDRSRLQTIASLRAGQPASVAARIVASALPSPPRPAF